MHPRLILAIMRKDALDFWLDKSKLGALLWPVILAGLWLVISHVAVARPTAMLVYNPGNSPLPQVISSTLASAQVTRASSPGEVTAAFGPTGTEKSSTYALGLIIPADFEQQLRAGARPQVTLYVDGHSLDAQQRLTLQTVIANYARSAAAPAPPLGLDVEVINPGPTAVSVFSLGKFYSLMVLPLTFTIGLAIMPGLYIEEKERKTLRWLLVTPASLSDILLGKSMVIMIYQLALSVLLVGMLGGFTGDVPMLLLYTLLGASFALALGLLIGAVFQTASAAGAVSGLAIMIYILPAVGLPLAPLFANNPLRQWIKILPTYYFADGAYNAMQQQGSPGSNLLDAGVILASTIAVFLLTVWILRRQAAVAGTI